MLLSQCEEISILIKLKDQISSRLDRRLRIGLIQGLFDNEA